jgi:GNAT superfamily N-acetyltransferase
MRIMIDRILIRPVRPDEYEKASALVLAVFDHDVAPLYVSSGIEVFHAYAAPEAMRNRSGAGHILLVAEKDTAIVGVAEARDFNHLSLLFVDPRSQNGGVGRSLLMEIIRLIKAEHPAQKTVTVNSSPNAVEAYKRFGFQPTGVLQRKEGIDFVPMVLQL